MWLTLKTSLPDRPSILAAVKALGNKVNTLAFRYLWPADREDQDDAWAGLLGCCWRAKRNLYILPPPGVHSLLAAKTRSFIEDKLENHLSRFKRMGRSKIAAMALAGEFRYVARVVRNHMVDHIRKVYRARVKPEPTAPFEPTKQEQQLVLASLREAGDRIANELGRGPYEALCAVVTAWPVSRSLRERKGKVTRAIMSARGVSRRQATEDRANLLYMIAESHDPFLIVLRTSAWFRYVFNLVPGPRFHFAEKSANRFISEEQRNDQTAQPSPERRAA